MRAPEGPAAVTSFGDELLAALTVHAQGAIAEVHNLGLGRPRTTSQQPQAVDGLAVPTGGTVAALILAGIHNIPVSGLNDLDPVELAQRESLRVLVNRALGGEVRSFKTRWLDALAHAARLGPDTMGPVREAYGRPGELNPDRLTRTIRHLARRNSSVAAPGDGQATAGRTNSALSTPARMTRRAGRSISEFADNDLLVVRDLQVHPALDSGTPHGFGALPLYVKRSHDRRLAQLVDAAQTGSSEIAILVGGSSTGKTRALWEAVRTLPAGWLIWHPLSPGAALAELGEVAPCTVVWLNEAQLYLGSNSLGEQFAEALRGLLRDPSRAPILVLATLWPEHWHTLTTVTNTDLHTQARVLLEGHRITVPKAFSSADLAALDTSDPRLREAAENAQDAQIVQYLAGVPALLERYEGALPTQRALIDVAMDARRLGAGLIPLAWLASAAPGYLTDAEWNATGDGENWLEQALADLSTPLRGIPGVLTPVKLGTARNQRVPLTTGGTGQERLYLLADYLDQHGRRERADQIPPVDFWTAAARHANPNDLNTLADSAWRRGLYRDAAQLHKNAVTHHDPSAPSALVKAFHHLNATDLRPIQWAVANTPIDKPAAVHWLLRALRSREQINALLARDPAYHAALDQPSHVSWLLDDLHAQGAEEQDKVLATRAAVGITLHEPNSVVWLLESLEKAGAQEQIDTLLARDPASQAALSNPGAVASLLKWLEKVGAQEQIDALLARDPASYAALDDPYSVVQLLESLQAAGAQEQVTALAARAAAHAALDNPYAVEKLLGSLRRAGADEEARMLATRSVAETAIDDPYAVTWLLDRLRKARAHEQVTALLARDPASHAALNDSLGVALLLDRLNRAEAHEQITTLASRAVTDVPLEQPYGVAKLLDFLRKAGTREQVAELLARDPASQAALDDPDGVAWLLGSLEEAGVLEQIDTLLARDPASRVALNEPFLVTLLLESLNRAGVQEQVTTLTARAAADVALEQPLGVAKLLEYLTRVGAKDQVTALLDRDPAAHAALYDPGSVVKLLEILRRVGAEEQVATVATRATTDVEIDDPDAVAWLLDTLSKVGAQQQALALAARIAAAGNFDQFLSIGDNHARFQFGREPDGTVARPWTWDDLE